MWVKVVGRKRVPRVGNPGEVRQLGGSAAKALIALGKVVPVDEPKAQPAPAPKKEAAPEPEKKPETKKKATKKTTKKKATKKSGTYKRRDMTAENTKSGD